MHSFDASYGHDLAWALAAACLLAADVLQQDSWLSVAWRPIRQGGDPYLVPFSAQDAAGIPLDEPPTTMTYGPLWAGVTALLAAISGGSGVLAWTLQKLVLLACWIACLFCVRALARSCGPRCEATALILPAGSQSACTSRSPRPTTTP